MELRKRRKSGVDLAFRTGFENMQLQAIDVRRFRHGLHHQLGIRAVRVNEQCQHLCLGNQFQKKLEPFGHQFSAGKADASKVATRSSDIRHQPGRDRVAANDKDNRDRLGFAVGRACRSNIVCCDQIDLASDEVGGERRQSVVRPFGPAKFNCDVLPLSISGFAQSHAKRGYNRSVCVKSRAAKEPDHRHRFLLRAGRERRGNIRTRQQDY